MSQWTHPPCGKIISGIKQEHCAVCCETFSTTRAGDRHRKGPYSARYCTDPATVGLVQDARGVWRLPVQAKDLERLQALRGTPTTQVA